MKLKKPCILLLCVAAAVGMSARAQDRTGADTFRNRCAICHGMDGLGQTPAGKLFNAASLKGPIVRSMSNRDLHDVIKNGKNKMPQFKNTLSDVQIDAVIAYVRKLSK